MRQQLVDAASGGQAAARARLQVRPRVVVVHPGRQHQAHDNSGALPSKLAADEQPCFSSHCNETDLVLNRVVMAGTSLAMVRTIS